HQRDEGAAGRIGGLWPGVLPGDIAEVLGRDAERGSHLGVRRSAEESTVDAIGISLVGIGTWPFGGSHPVSGWLPLQRFAADARFEEQRLGVLVERIDKTPR